MENSNAIATPLEAGIRYSRHQANTLTNDKQQLMDHALYNQAIGSLQYFVTCTRWNLAFAVKHLAQFVQSPTLVHWLGVKCIFRYFRGTSPQGLIYTNTTFGSNFHKLCRWSDAD